MLCSIYSAASSSADARSSPAAAAPAFPGSKGSRHLPSAAPLAASALLLLLPLPALLPAPKPPAAQPLRLLLWKPLHSRPTPLHHEQQPTMLPGSSCLPPTAAGCCRSSACLGRAACSTGGTPRAAAARAESAGVGMEWTPGKPTRTQCRCTTTSQPAGAAAVGSHMEFPDLTSPPGPLPTRERCRFWWCVTIRYTMIDSTANRKRKTAQGARRPGAIREPQRTACGSTVDHAAMGAACALCMLQLLHARNPP